MNGTGLGGDSMNFVDELGGFLAVDDMSWRVRCCILMRCKYK